MSIHEDPRKRITVALEPETYRAVKVRLAEEGMTMQEIGEQLFGAWIAGMDRNETPTEKEGGLVEIEQHADGDADGDADEDAELDDVMAGLLGAP